MLTTTQRLLLHQVETAQWRRVLPEVHWLTPLEMLSALLLLPKPDHVLTFKIDVPYALALRLWPGKIKKVDLSVEGAVPPHVEWKLLVASAPVREPSEQELAQMSIEQMEALQHRLELRKQYLDAREGEPTDG